MSGTIITILEWPESFFKIFTKSEIKCTLNQMFSCTSYSIWAFQVGGVRFQENVGSGWGGGCWGMDKKEKKN